MVLDQEHRQVELVLDLLDELAQLLGLLGVHAGGGLVQQQQGRLRGQGPGDLQLALLAVGQGGGQLVAHVVQIDDPQQLVGVGAHLLLLLAVGAEDGGEQAGGLAQVHGGEHVVKHRHGFEQADVLEGAGDAQLGDIVRGMGHGLGILAAVFAGVELFHLAPGIVGDQQLVVEIDRAVGGLVHAGDGVEGGGLAGAVGADQGHDLALENFHGEIVHGDDAAELHGDVL